MTAYTTIPDLPAVVDRWVAGGKRLNISRIARDARCSEWAVQHYLRRVGLKGPPRPYRGPPRTRRPAEHAVPPTPGEVRAMAAEIRRENMAEMAARVYRWPTHNPFEVKIYRCPKGILA